MAPASSVPLLAHKDEPVRCSLHTQTDTSDRMDNHIMSSNKFAAVVGLGVSAMLLVKGGELLDSADIGSRTWIKTGFGAPARAAVCVFAGASLLAIGWMYRLLFCPLELLRTPDDVGYIAEKGRSRAQAANEVRRRRKTGELPPVYPNGWYRVLDSHMLDRGEVKNVSALGMISWHLQCFNKGIT